MSTSFRRAQPLSRPPFQRQVSIKTGRVKFYFPTTKTGKLSLIIFGRDSLDDEKIGPDHAGAPFHPADGAV